MCICGFCNVWMCVCVDFVMCCCEYLCIFNVFVFLIVDFVMSVSVFMLIV